MQGYIKIYRKIVENPLWLIKPFSEGQAWIDLLCITTYDKGFIKSKNGQIINLERGDCGYSILSLSKRWGWSRGKVTRFFSLLNEHKMIQQKTYGKHTIINILNFDKFQKRTTNDTTNDTTNGHYQESKERKESIYAQFLEFYDAYPKKKSKSLAERAFFKAVKQTDFEKIMQGLTAYKEDIRKKHTDEQYIKYPATWLNQECWNDEYKTKEEKNYVYNPYL